MSIVLTSMRGWFCRQFWIKDSLYCVNLHQITLDQEQTWQLMVNYFNLIFNPQQNLKKWKCRVAQTAWLLLPNDAEFIWKICNLSCCLGMLISLSRFIQFLLSIRLLSCLPEWIPVRFAIHMFLVCHQRVWPCGWCDSPQAAFGHHQDQEALQLFR